MGSNARPRVAVVNDYEVVIAGLASILSPYEDHLEITDAILVDQPLSGHVDVALYDTFGRAGVEEEQIAKLLAQPEIERVAIYSFNFADEAVEQAIAAGASGYLSKAMPAKALVQGLVAVSNGERVVAGPTGVGRSTREERGWPGQDLGLSEREAEVVALAALGQRNADIAAALYVSVDTVKTHLARSFRKLGVHNRTELSALVHRRPSFRRMLPDAER